MSEQHQHNDSLPKPEAGQDVVALIKKMQQQLESLEKKVDILINQSQAKPYSEKRFSKPFRSFGPSHHRPDRERDNTFGERGYRPRRHFEKRNNEESREFSPRKREYDNPQESAPARPTEGHFKRRYGQEDKGFDPKKKPFFHKRRDRG